MLKNSSSRSVSNKKQALMADQTSLLSPTSPISSFLSSPRFFTNLLSKNNNNLSDSDSPTSILDSKNPSSFGNPFGQNHNHSATSKPGEAAEAIGLALLDSILEEKAGQRDDGSFFSKPVNRMALFGSKLKVQIPVVYDSNSVSPAEDLSPKSPAEFGIKTRNSQQVLTPATREFSRQLSLKEMEMSEDYTCVITHGPNPKTTHIFDDCIVECCCGDEVVVVGDDGCGKFSDLKKPEAECDGLEESNVPSSPPQADFLGYCHTCKGILEHGKDAACIYRGDERAFWSHECRCKEMVSEKKQESS